MSHFSEGTSPSADESCSQRAPGDRVTAPFLLPSLTGGCCALSAGGHRVHGGLPSSWQPCSPSRTDPADEFFIRNQIKGKVIRFELAVTNTIDCVDFVI